MILSIITINYNNKAGLQKTIDSVITQTFKDFEFIIIDDCSMDNSLKILKDYASSDDRIKHRFNLLYFHFLVFYYSHTCV